MFSPLIKDRLFKMFVSVLLAIALICAFLVFTSIFFRGVSSITFDFLTSASEGAGFDGGIFYQLLGTLILITTAAALVIPFAVSLALLHSVYLKPGKLRSLVVHSLYLLNSTPSILFGIVGFLFFVKQCGWQKSWLSGGILLAIMILPTVTLSLLERFRTIPQDYLETSKALGLDQQQLIWKVLLPYAWGGILTGVVLGLARAAAETAPIMFTAAVFSGATLPTGIKDSPILALPYHIFNLTQDGFNPKAMDTAWGSALVLTAGVFCITLFAIPFRARSHEEAK